jgi:tellurite resistance protein
MEGELLATLATVGAACLAGLHVYRSSRTPIVRAPHRWNPEAEATPTIERIARGPVLRQAVLLACEMARSDGDVDATEREAIRQFLLERVDDADETFAERMCAEGLGGSSRDDAVDAAISTIRAVGSPPLRRMVLELLLFVAHADGKIHPNEIRFMARVGNGIGLQPSAVERILQP